MVTNDAGLISGLLLCICGETEVVKACFFHFSRKWIKNLVKLSNIIWRDYANVQARLIIGCSNLR